MYIWDLENTLTNSDHRNHLALARQWDAFHALFPQDQPRRSNIRLFQICAKTDKVIILTGMPERHQDMATKWMQSNGIFPDLVIMRKDGDFRSSPEFKLSTIHKMRWRPIMLFDDRIDVVQIMLENGIPAIQVTA